MTRYAIDARTLLHLVDNGITPDPAHQLVAPGWLRSDALQLLLDDVRAGTRTERDALTTHERVTEVKVRLLADRVSRRTAWDLARAHAWERLHDAEYLAVTRLQADALIALDPGLVALADGIVPLAEVTDLTH
jgi:hypothetical protein